MNDPKEVQMKVVNYILRYLKKTIRKGLHFKKDTSKKKQIFIYAYGWVFLICTGKLSDMKKKDTINGW